jgi:hypothetical protein
MRDDEETQLRPSLDQCFQFIDEAMATGGGVLVHWYVAVAQIRSLNACAHDTTNDTTHAPSHTQQLMIGIVAVFAATLECRARRRWS